MAGPKDLGVMWNSLGNQRSVLGEVLGHTDSIESFKKNSCISSKNRLFSKGLVHVFLSKMTKVWSRHFSLVYGPKDLGLMWNSLVKSFLSANNAQTKNFFLTVTPISSFVDYFFVHRPLEGLKSILEDVFGHTDSIGSF